MWPLPSAQYQLSITTRNCRGACAGVTGSSWLGRRRRGAYGGQPPGRRRIFRGPSLARRSPAKRQAPPTQGASNPACPIPWRPCRPWWRSGLHRSSRCRGGASSRRRRGRSRTRGATSTSTKNRHLDCYRVCAPLLQAGMRRVLLRNPSPCSNRGPVGSSSHYNPPA